VGVEVTVTAEDDTLADGDQECTVTLAAASSLDPAYDGLDPDDVTVTVEDDDLPTVAFSAATYSVGEADGSATITVDLSGASAVTATVGYATANGTATAGSDYTSASGTLTFAPGVTTRTFSVPITSDSRDENDETVSLSLSSPSNATLGPPDSATLTIRDEDAPPTVQFRASAYQPSPKKLVGHHHRHPQRASGLTRSSLAAYANAPPPPSATTPPPAAP
jgi:hypothetical protein